jgi:SIR2-like domain
MANSVSKHSVEDLAQALKDARERGQQIVPIVGAGLSADCGFPVITAVVRYLGRLYRYIRLRGPVYDYREHKVLSHDIFERHFSRYELRPWEFLEDFGWPDWFQLNEDLFTKFEVKSAKVKPSGEWVSGLIESAEREELDDVLRQFNPHGTEEYARLYKAIDGVLTKLKNRKSTKNSKLQKPIDESYDTISLRFQSNWSKSAKFDVIGDWRRLILYFTNYRSDHADALFARFGATRKPGQGHRFLAFLSKILAIRTILTFNFDSLIEEALELEGIRCKVFAMERGAGLPYQNLLRDQLSVIKAHGSTHALLLDEQLDRPLSKEYLKRFYRITGEDPVLLVVGCSAEDRRLRDLVSHVLGNSQQELSVAWLHYEPTPPLFLKKIAKRLRRKIFTLPTNNPGATLSHLYSWLTNSNPASHVPYLAHVQQPIELAADRPKQSSNGLSSGWTKGQFDWFAVDESRFLTASQILLKRANEWAQNGYQVIWIDLESLHTFAGVIGSIIDQCRKYDPDLAPSLLPVDVDKVQGNGTGDAAFLRDVVEPAAKRVVRALRRARYYLAMDGLSTYAWPATTHHGMPHTTNLPDVHRRVDRMIQFLETLEEYDLGESRVGVGLDNLTPRFEGPELRNPDGFERLFGKAKRQREEEERWQRKKAKSNRPFVLSEHFSQFEDLPILSLKDIGSELARILSTGSAEDSDKRHRALIAMVLFSLSCFRRTRPLVATKHLLEPFLRELPAPDSLQQILKAFTEPSHIGILQQLEGGSYWFNHSIRDELYTKNTEYTSTKSMRRCLDVDDSSAANSEFRRNAVFQLFLGSITHQRISQIWYNDTFVQSQDTFAFLEYTYHRISSIRNLVKLRGLAQVGANEKVPNNELIAEDLVKGISRCGQLIRLVSEKNPPFRDLGFGDTGPFATALRESPQQDSSGSKWSGFATQIEESLQRRHRRLLHGLYRGWTRAELILRTQVPAEQLLHWCDVLLTDDLVNRCNSVVIGYLEPASESSQQAVKPEFYNFGSASKPRYLVDPKLENEGEDLKEFRRFLQDLQVKLWIERSDYETCISHRRQHLWHSLGETVPPAREDIENWPEVIGRCKIRQCHQLLNIANCQLKLQQELTSDEDGLKKQTAKILELLDRIKNRVKHLKPKTPADRAAESNEYNEARLRLLHLQTEAEIGHVSVFSHDGFTGNPQAWKPKATNVVNARRLIDQGLDEIGGRDVHTRAAPRSVILHPTTDAALYLQYRSLFYMFKGRTEWLLDPENKAGGLQKTLRAFEMARGGLDDDSSLLSALIEIYWTEALLARGRAVLFTIKTGNEFHEAQQVYDSARGALRRAREALLVSHRHLMWRKLFFRICTQYHSDRLLLRHAKLQERAFTRKKRSESDMRKYFEENAREALLRLRRAYQTLVSALDLYLPLSEKNESEREIAHLKRFRWLYRMWWELTLCGYATGRVVIEAIRGRTISPDQADDYVIQQLKWLNKADGVDDSALKNVFEQNYEALKGKYEDLLAVNEGDPLKTALKRRQKLIEQANDFSGKQVAYPNGNRT